MGTYLGIDTSNYTTSAALFDSGSGEVTQVKKLLPVKHGETGLRQSDAVFHHTVQLPEIMRELFGEKNVKPDAVSVSTKPRWIDGSYMPCFMAGRANAVSVSCALNIPMYEFSHQLGHIAAALYSVKRLDLVNREFIAFHISGGTTEALLVTPDSDKVMKAQIVSSSLDLKAGQAIDRAGVMLGLDFPAGAALDRLSQKSGREFKIKPKLKDGCCCLSGLENQCRNMLEKGESAEDIAKFCITGIYENIAAMCGFLKEKYPDLPFVFAGGVMSNSYIRNRITEEFGAYFAKPEFSSDNAAGLAVLGYLKELQDGKCNACRADGQPT